MRNVVAVAAAIVLLAAPITAASAKPRAAPAAKDWTAVATMAPSGGFVLGNPSAPVKLIEYASFTCPHCAHFSATAMGPLRAGYIRTGKVSLEIRTAVRDRVDLAATLLARCGGPAHYFGAGERIFATQDQWLSAAMSSEALQGTPLTARPPAEVLASVALGAGLDTLLEMSAARVRACVAAKADAARVEAMTDEAWNRRRISGTPFFLVNGVAVAGSDWASVEAALRRALG